MLDFIVNPDMGTGACHAGGHLFEAWAQFSTIINFPLHERNAVAEDDLKIV